MSLRAAWKLMWIEYIYIMALVTKWFNCTKNINGRPSYSLNRLVARNTMKQRWWWWWCWAGARMLLLNAVPVVAAANLVFAAAVAAAARAVDLTDLASTVWFLSRPLGGDRDCVDELIGLMAMRVDVWCCMMCVSCLTHGAWELHDDAWCSRMCVVF